MKAKIQYRIFSETARKYEIIDLDEAELISGQKIIKVFWCNLAERFVTIPGASIFVVNNNLDLVLSDD